MRRASARRCYLRGGYDYTVAHRRPLVNWFFKTGFRERSRRTANKTSTQPPRRPGACARRVSIRRGRVWASALYFDGSLSSENARASHCTKPIIPQSRGLSPGGSLPGIPEQPAGDIPLLRWSRPGSFPLDCPAKAREFLPTPDQIPACLLSVQSFLTNQSPQRDQLVRNVQLRIV